MKQPIKKFNNIHHKNLSSPITKIQEQDTKIWEQNSTKIKKTNHINKTPLAHQKDLKIKNLSLLKGTEKPIHQKDKLVHCKFFLSLQWRLKEDFYHDWQRNKKSRY